MTSEQKQLVQSSWAQVIPIADKAAVLFYDRLFAVNPEVRSLFPSNMAGQRKKLMQTIAIVVNSLEKWDDIEPAVRTLGARHAAMPIGPREYDAVGAALIWTLGQGLGEKFTPEVEEAWLRAYGLIAATMQAASAAPI